MVKDKIPYKILIVEDNPGDLLIVEDLLTEQIENPEIVAAIHFAQAREKIVESGATFDVILLDLTLPDNSGQKLIEDMISLANFCPIIILTGYAEIQFSIQSISLGISDYLIKDELNNLVLYKSILYAIERKKTHSRLVDSEKRYSDLFHFSPQPMWVCCRSSLQILDVNHAAVDQYLYSEDEFLKMGMLDMIAADNIPELLEKIAKQNIDQSVICQVKFIRNSKSGEPRLVDIYISHIEFKEKRAMLILVNDVTERMEHIHSIEHQNEKLREIAWIQSHVVRAPLARMMGIVNMIGLGPAVPPEFGMVLEKFMESAKELDQIVREIATKTEIFNSSLN